MPPLNKILSIRFNDGIMMPREGITKAAADAANEKSIIGLYRTCVKFVMHDVT